MSTLQKFNPLNINVMDEDFSQARENVNQAVSAWQTYADNKRNQRNFEAQMQFQEDSMRSQMMYQTAMYNRAHHDNSITALMEQYRMAGLDPREALNAQPNHQAPSAPSGMSAPRAPQADSSMLNAMFQRQHESRLDDVQRALSASRLLSDESQRNHLQTSAYKMLQDALNDSKRVNIEDASLAVKWYDVISALEQQKAELEERKRQHDESLKETHRHNVAVETDDPYKHMLDNITYTIDYMLDKMPEDVKKAKEVIRRTSEDVKAGAKGVVDRVKGYIPRKVKGSNAPIGSTATYR